MYQERILSNMEPPERVRTAPIAVVEMCFLPIAHFLSQRHDDSPMLPSTDATTHSLQDALPMDGCCCTVSRLAPRGADHDEHANAPPRPRAARFASDAPPARAAPPHQVDSTTARDLPGGRRGHMGARGVLQ